MKFFFLMIFIFAKSNSFKDIESDLISDYIYLKSSSSKGEINSAKYKKTKAQSLFFFKKQHQQFSSLSKDKRFSQVRNDLKVIISKFENLIKNIKEEKIKKYNVCNKEDFNSFKEKLSDLDVSGALVSAILINNLERELHLSNAYKRAKATLKAKYVDSIIGYKALDFFLSSPFRTKETIREQKNVLIKKKVKDIKSYQERVQNILNKKCYTDFIGLSEHTNLELTRRRAHKIIQVITSIKNKVIDDLFEIEWSRYPDELLEENWDGWNNEYKLVKSKNQYQSLISAGKDAEFGTKDDLVFNF